MIDGLKPYPAYKNSGLPWLGEIPAHWSAQSAPRQSSAVFMCAQRTERKNYLPFHQIVGIVPRRSTSVTMFKAASYKGYKLCWPGDLVINSLWAWSRGLGVSRFHGIVSTAYSVYRLRNGDDFEPDFLHEFLRSVPFHWELFVRSKGVWISRLQLTDLAFLDAPLVKPPKDEQLAVIRFLRVADLRIQKFIRAKQSLIKLLEEEKQATIHRAVTRGLDASARLKPSGVPWLGEVPERWEIVALKRVCTLLRDGTHLPPPRQEFGVPLLSVRNIIRGRFVRRDDDSFISDDDYKLLCHSFTPQHDDVPLAIVGATLGKVAIVPRMEPFQI